MRHFRPMAAAEKRTVERLLKRAKRFSAEVFDAASKSGDLGPYLAVMMAAYVHEEVTAALRSSGELSRDQGYVDWLDNQIAAADRLGREMALAKITGFKMGQVLRGGPLTEPLGADGGVVRGQAGGQAEETKE